MSNFINAIPFYHSTISLTHPMYMNMRAWDDKQIKLLLSKGLDVVQARMLVNEFVSNNSLNFTEGVPKVNVVKDEESEK